MNVVDHRSTEPRALLFQQLDPTNDRVLVFDAKRFVPQAELIDVLDLSHAH
jgi:hypothetical protein